MNELKLLNTHINYERKQGELEQRDLDEEEENGKEVSSKPVLNQF